MKDYYKTLEVERTASADDIKQAYRRLAKLHHPDKNPGNTASDAAFKEINEAYQTLSDAAKKNEYDTMLRFGGRTQFNRTRQQTYQEYDPWVRANEAFKRAVMDTQVQYTLTVEQLFADKDPVFNYHREGKCPTCSGKGYTGPEEETVCATCGDSTYLEPESVTLKGARGVRGRYTFRFAKKGNFNRHAGQYGDLLVIALTQPHNRFGVHGDDLLAEIPVHYQDAIDGAKVEFVHVDGKKLAVQLPKRATDGQLIKLAQQGLPSHLQGRGSLLLQINVFIDYARVLEDKPEEPAYNVEQVNEDTHGSTTEK